MADDTTRPAGDTDTADPMSNWVPLELSHAERVKWAEARIAELAPLEHVAVQKVNDVLTDEQHVARLRASQQGQNFGLTGLPLFQHIMGTLQLSDEQKTALREARRELREIREGVAPHVALILDEKQRGRIRDSEFEAE